MDQITYKSVFEEDDLGALCKSPKRVPLYLSIISASLSPSPTEVIHQPWTPKASKQML